MDPMGVTTCYNTIGVSCGRCCHRHRAMPQALRTGRGAQGPLLPHQEAIGGTAGDPVGATHGQTWRGTGTLEVWAQLRWEEREDFS